MRPSARRRLHRGGVWRILPARPRPPFAPMKIVLGSDHAGYVVKESLKAVLAARGDCETADAGCFSAESCDYPLFAEKVAAAVETGEADFGILVCTTGAGMTIAPASSTAPKSVLERL